MKEDPYASIDRDARKHECTYITYSVTRSLRKFWNCTFALAGPDQLNGINCRTSFVNLHHYCSSKLTSKHICLRFIMT